MKVKQADLYTFTLAFMIFGFYFQVSFFDFIGQTNSSISIIYRAIIILAAFYLIMFGKSNRKDHISLLLFFAFAFVYFYSLLRSIVLEGENLAFNPDYYFLMFFGGVVIPSLLWLGVNHLDIDKFKKLSKILLLLTCFFVSVKYYLFTGELTKSRLETESISPIIIGHVALSLLILTVVDLKAGKFYQYLIILFCITLIFLSQSRSAFIASAIIFTLYLTKKISLKVILTYFIVGLVTILAVLPLIEKLNSAVNAEFNTFRYIKIIGSNEDLSSMSRFTSFKGAWSQFVDSPILGDHIEERTTKYYPHNIILEALMSTGVVGGVPLVLLILLTIYRAQRLLNISDRGIVLSLLFYQYFTLAMFSSSIYLNTQLWYFMIGVNMVYLKSVCNKN